uniref:Uncharacterized protein n=1 Tax=Aegilops tauschii subsp. strangulata TaxID=200361 RepID=A0A453LXJ9_AEGTS
LSAGLHQITGNGVGFKPDILDMDIMEKVLEVKGEDAVKMALQEGLPADYIEVLLNLWNFRMWGYHQLPTRWQ